MSALASTPEPPYYTVIFSSVRSNTEDGYDDTALRMVQLAAEQPGYLGIESARSGIGITVSYWRDLESIKQWKQNAEHLQAQKSGRQKWYDSFVVRGARVDKEYRMGDSPATKPNAED